MTAVIIVVLLVALVVAGAMIGVRSAKETPEEWHTDPLTAAEPTTPNSYRVGPLGVGADREAGVSPMNVDELAAAFDAIALGDSRVSVLAGSAADGHVTYVQRSALFGFPDYISVKFLEVEGGSTLAVFSRSRFGHSDLGVNKKRVERWLGELPA